MLSARKIPKDLHQKPPHTAPTLWIDDDLDRLGRDTVNDNNEVASTQLLVRRDIERRGYEIIRCNGHAAVVVRPAELHVPGSPFCDTHEWVVGCGLDIVSVGGPL